MSMPKHIYLPEPEDFCRYHLQEGEQCCFIGWRNMLLPNLDFEEEDQFEREALKVAGQMKLCHNNLVHHPWSPRPRISISHYNDHLDNNFRRLSTWFRKTIEQMGYDIS